MSTQILALRFFKDKLNAGEIRARFCRFDKQWFAPSVADLFLEPDLYLQNIPESDRYNLFYTCAHVPGDPLSRKTRPFNGTDIIPFDIDLKSKTEVMNDDLCKRIHHIVCGVLDVDPAFAGCLNSGHGCQTIVQIKNPILNKAELENYQNIYRVFISRIDSELESQGISARCDMVLDAARVMRVPNTINRKQGRPDALARVVQANISPQDFHWGQNSVVKQAPILESFNEFLPKSVHKILNPSYEVSAILNGCIFLKYCRESALVLKEPEWFAMLGVLVFLPNGPSLCHEWSKPYQNYSEKECGEKIAHALEASGPRLCQSINRVWGRCGECPHFGLVKTPVQIKSSNTIRTESSNFRDIFRGKDGVTIRSARHNHTDLVKAFKRDHKYIVTEGGQVMEYVKTHYNKRNDSELLAWAEDKWGYYPTDLTKTCHRNEFLSLVKTHNVKSSGWFNDTTYKKINLLNGVLDIPSGHLLPHSPEYGFVGVVPYAYDPAATCPIFDKFMGEITLGRKDLESVLLEFFGYAIANDTTWLQKALFMIGPTASNGKSTLASVLSHLVGPEMQSNIDIREFSREQNRALLENKAFNISRDAGVDGLADSEAFKKIVTGEPITIKNVFERPYEIKPRAKIIVLCNEMPKSADKTNGLYRRILAVPFEAIFSDELGNRDPFMEDKLLTELPGIFNRVLSAYRDLIKRRALTKSDWCERALKEYKVESDSVGLWFDDCVSVEDDTRTIKRDTLYDSYKNYCLSSGYRPVSKIHFFRRLVEYLPDYHVRVSRFGGGRYSPRERMVTGIRLIGDVYG